VDAVHPSCAYWNVGRLHTRPSNIAGLNAVIPFNARDSTGSSNGKCRERQTNVRREPIGSERTHANTRTPFEERGEFEGGAEGQAEEQRRSQPLAFAAE